MFFPLYDYRLPIQIIQFKLSSKILKNDEINYSELLVGAIPCHFWENKILQFNIFEEAYYAGKNLYLTYPRQSFCPSQGLPIYIPMVTIGHGNIIISHGQLII